METETRSLADPLGKVGMAASGSGGPSIPPVVVLGGLCCLLVAAGAVVLIVWLVKRSRGAPNALPTQPPVPTNPAPWPAAPAPVDIPDQLRKLAELRDAGVLTDEEFLAQKARLLGS